MQTDDIESARNTLTQKETLAGEEIERLKVWEKQLEEKAGLLESWEEKLALDTKRLTQAQKELKHAREKLQSQFESMKNKCSQLEENEKTLGVNLIYSLLRTKSKTDFTASVCWPHSKFCYQK